MIKQVIDTPNCTHNIFIVYIHVHVGAVQRKFDSLIQEEELMMEKKILCLKQLKERELYQ